MTPAEAAQVFRTYQDADDYESLMWRVSDDHAQIELFVNCSDFFYWATADCEEVTADDLPALRQALTDLDAADGTEYLGELFAARKRHLRPQGPAYKHMNPATVALFNACCTEEERADADRRDAAWWAALAHRIKKGEK